VTGARYRVTSDVVDEGGFGEIYQGVSLYRDGSRRAAVAIKAGVDATAWHGEAYWGQLLAGDARVVKLHDAFPIAEGLGRRPRTVYLLVFDWMDGGTVHDVLTASQEPWPERLVERGIRPLLEVLVRLHRRGIYHGDITPRNVFVRDTALLLGDFGIARQSLEDGPVSMHGRAPTVFVPRDARDSHWSPSEDVYQVGLIALSLLAGQVITSHQVCGRALRGIEASDTMKGWLRDALVSRQERFRDATEALAFLRTDKIKPAPNPKSLRAQNIVFTGTIQLKRTVASARAERAGATVQPKVNGQTTLIVAGEPNPLMIGQKQGTKLFDAHRRIRRGQRIAIMDGKRFQKLLEASGTARTRS
jgi:serine/threonine protein kinase